MTTLRQSFLSAIIKQLLRGKSLLQAFLAFWIASPPSTTTSSTTPQASLPPVAPHAPGLRRSARDFLREAEDLILRPLVGDGLPRLSSALKAQFRDGLLNRTECMLPSYNHQLPTGSEEGRYLALDVGGSTLRVALVELHGTPGGSAPREGEMVRIRSFPIGAGVKALEGASFFDWLAARVVETLAGEREGRRDASEGALPMALSWSFPIEQTSLRGGRIHGMGKGFRAADGLEGHDLGAVIEEACRRAGLEAEVRAILNDGNATLMSCAYAHPATRFGLILGTGVNIAAFLPVSLVGGRKFGERPPSWAERARSVIVNTELGMFGGGGALAVTRWDALLKQGHPRPDFQPLEHMVSGMYLGEVARFAVLEAVEATGLLGGVVPPSLLEPYSLSTETMSIIQSDTAPFEKSTQAFSDRHPSSHTPTTTDMDFLGALSSLISRRSAAIVAASLHAIWELRLEGLREAAAALSPADGPALALAAEEVALERTMVAFNGSVVESYPGYRETCQGLVDGLVAASTGSEGPAAGERTSMARIDLVPARESSILGAGVALAATMAEEEAC